MSDQPVIVARCRGCGKLTLVQPCHGCTVEVCWRCQQQTCVCRPAPVQRGEGVQPTERQTQSALAFAACVLGIAVIVAAAALWAWLAP